MKRYSWALAILTLAALPPACSSSSSSGGYGGQSPDAGDGVSADQCNPVTNDGCTTAGAVCDLDPASGFFVCYGPPNTAGVCDACDANTTCGPGLTCVLPEGEDTGLCYRYCCTNADCGAGNTCDATFATELLDPANPRDDVGLCVGNTSTYVASCAATAPSSGGGCVMGFLGSTDAGTSDAGDGGTPEDAGTSSSDGGALDASTPSSDGG
jgi:hypothetical protein